MVAAVLQASRAPAYSGRNGRWAIGVSLLLHAVLILGWREATRHQTISPPPLEVRLQVWQPLAPPRVADKPVLPPLKNAGEPARPTEARPAPTLRVAPLPATTAPALSLPEPETPPATSLTERALAGVREAERSLKQEGEQRQHLLPRGELPNNLRKLPPPVLTAMAKSFDNHLSELIVLEVREQQEGSNRVTVIYTNKGVYCAYSPILKKSFLRGMPTVTQFGTCSPQ